MEEFLYCVTARGWARCKIGVWQGQYADLWSRYATTLGPDEVKVTVFWCDGRRPLEKVVFGYLRKHHVSGEVFDQAAFQPFLHICSILCYDSVPIPASTQEAFEQNAEKQRQRLERQLAQQKKAARKEQNKALRAAAQQAQEARQRNRLAEADARQYCETQKQKVIRDFVLQSVVVGEARDFVRAKDLWDGFQKKHDKATRKGRHVLTYAEFRSNVEEVLHCQLKARH